MMCAAAVGGLQACRSRGAGGAMAPPCFGITVSPISTRGAYHTPNMHYYLAPPDFQALLRPCRMMILEENSQLLHYFPISIPIF